MARKHKREEVNRRVSRVEDPQTRIPETQPRSIDTENQMRDFNQVARASIARRFDEAQRLIKQRIESLRRMQVEDLRHDRKDLPRQTYKRLDGGTANVVRRPVRKDDLRQQGLSTPLRDVFQNPRESLVCVRRRARRAVLFALQRTGKGGAKNRKARWTEKSNIVCRKVK